MALMGRELIHGRSTVFLTSYTEKRKTKKIQKRERQKTYRKEEKEEKYFFISIKLDLKLKFESYIFILSIVE